MSTISKLDQHIVTEDYDCWSDLLACDFCGKQFPATGENTEEGGYSAILPGEDDESDVCRSCQKELGIVPCSYCAFFFEPQCEYDELCPQCEHEGGG